MIQPFSFLGLVVGIAYGMFAVIVGIGSTAEGKRGLALAKVVFLPVFLLFTIAANVALWAAWTWRKEQ